MPAPEPHDDRSTRPSRVLQQQGRLGRPTSGGATAIRRHLVPHGRVEVVGRREVRSGPDEQFARPARVPQVAVQVEAETPAGTGMRMAAGARLGTGSVPQGQADPLTGVGPGGWGPHHEVHKMAGGARYFGVVPCQSDRQPGAQQPVRSNPRQVPAQQVRHQVPQIGPHPGGEFPAVGAGQ